MKYTPPTPPPTMEEFKDVLRKHSLKVTPQRLAVHEAMLSIGHGAAEDVAEAITAGGKAKVTIASVYNILTQMALLGVYSHRLGIGSRMIFDVTTGDHLHLYDSYNDIYHDIEDETLMELVLARLGKRRFKGYRVEGIDVTVLCRPSSMNKRKPAKKKK